MPHTHGPIIEEQRKRMNDLARFLDEIFNGKGEPKKIGFALLVYEFGDHEDGRINYIGNGQRSDVRTALEELLGRWKKEDTQ